MHLRAATFYLNFIPERGGTPEREEPQGLRDLNGERENILAVLQGCWSGGERGVVAELEQLMARWLFIESHWNDLEKWENMAAAAAKEVRKPHTAARILNEVGRTYPYRF